MKRILYSLLLLAAFSGALKSANDKKKAAVPPPPASPLDRYVAEAEARRGDALATTPGSIWIAGSRLADAARDVRASQTDDILTIVVAEQASAVTSGATTTARKSSTANSITALLGIKSATGPLANLANVSGDTELAGTGTTTRSTTLNTILSRYCRAAQRQPGGGSVQGYPDQLRAPDHHRARRRPPERYRFHQQRTIDSPRPT